MAESLFSIMQEEPLASLAGKNILIIVFEIVLIVIEFDVKAVIKRG